MPRRVPRISHCIDAAREDRAQSTVEAAFLLPTFLTLILLALQPVCLLYTRAVMESAAAETARIMTTTTVNDDADLEEFARRRLAAVPNVSIFHAGGPLSWDIELGRRGRHLVRIYCRRREASARDRRLCAVYGHRKRGRIR